MRVFSLHLDLSIPLVSLPYGIAPFRGVSRLYENLGKNSWACCPLSSWEEAGTLSLMTFCPAQACCECEGSTPPQAGCAATEPQWPGFCFQCWESHLVLMLTSSSLLAQALKMNFPISSAALSLPSQCVQHQEEKRSAIYCRLLQRSLNKHFSVNLAIIY